MLDTPRGDTADAAGSPAAGTSPGTGSKPSATTSDGNGILAHGVSVAIDGFEILRHVSLHAATGSALSILGPSGCGKTTLLRVLAGLERIHSGEVWLGDRLVAGADEHVAPEKRNIGLVFQDWALFPHLTVMQNIVFGLPRSERRHPSKEVLALLEMVGIAELADRTPGSLSGGQQQRVALARALAPQPAVLLLDEPFSSLDTSLRVDVRSEVAELLKVLGVTSVFVTHDQDEAFVLGDEVAVMRDGTVVQQSTPSDLYARPADLWLAGFVGEADTVLGVAEGSMAQTELGPIALNEKAIGAVEVLVRPEEVRIVAGDLARVERVEYFGHDTLYALQSDTGSALRCRMTGAPAYIVGDRVGLRHSGTPTVSFPSRLSRPTADR